MKALAVDLGGTHATCAVVEERKILASRKLDLDSAQGLAAYYLSSPTRSETSSSNSNSNRRTVPV